MWRTCVALVGDYDSPYVGTYCVFLLSTRTLQVMLLHRAQQAGCSLELQRSLYFRLDVVLDQLRWFRLQLAAQYVSDCFKSTNTESVGHPRAGFVQQILLRSSIAVAEARPMASLAQYPTVS